MNAQLDLFSAPATAGRSRRADARTARAAGRSVDAAARKAEVMAALTSLGVPSTAWEIHAALGGPRPMDIGSVRSRLSQLAGENPPRVRVVGERTVPKPVGSGRPEQLWSRA